MIARREFLARLARSMAAWCGLPALLDSSPLVSKPAARNTEPPPPIAAALSAEAGETKLIESDRLSLEAPQVAEDGAIVPIAVETDLPGVTELVLLVEKNPNPLAARFKFHGGAIPYVSTRLKMNETCDVIALAKTHSGLFTARRTVKVLVGGCG